MGFIGFRVSGYGMGFRVSGCLSRVVGCQGVGFRV